MPLILTFTNESQSDRLNPPMWQPIIQRWREVIVLLLLWITFLPHAHATSHDLVSGDTYVSEYGMVDPRTHAKAARAKAIFDRLVQISGYQAEPSPQLIILPKSAAPWENWAMCLPDGSIILVESILDLCFQEDPHPVKPGPPGWLSFWPTNCLT